MSFTHLHVHSHYSLNDSINPIDKLVEKAKQLNATALAVSEHGSLRSSYDFWKECSKRNIKPILGIEAYIVDDHTQRNPDEKNKHILLLAQNEVGWNNLKELSAIAAIDGFYRNPRIDLDLLKRFNQGIICTTACVGGVLSWELCKADPEQETTRCGRGMQWAIYYFRKLLEIFGTDRFFLEIQLLDMVNQHYANQMMLSLSQKFNVPLVLTTDCHYLNAEEAKVHDILIRSARSKTLADGEGYCYGTDQIWMKSEQEIWDTYYNQPFRYISPDQIKSAMANTVAIAESVESYRPYKTKDTYPKFTTDKFEGDTFKFLCALAWKGFKEKGLDKQSFKEQNEKYKARLFSELKAIKESGFTDYFLIVWDIINYARQIDTLIGCGRGSMSGSLVFYCLGCVTLDPITYNLPFERFLKPGQRVSPPDADLDFEAVKVPEIVAYIKQKYGKDKVCNISTSNTLQLRGAVKDVARVFGIDFAETNSATEKIPFKARSFKELDEIKESKEKTIIQSYFDAHPEVERIARRLEGTPKHPSVHAAGILITPTKTQDWIPVGYVATSETKVCEWDMYAIEEINLLKVDILRLNTLDIIKKILGMINF